MHLTMWGYTNRIDKSNITDSIFICWIQPNVCLASANQNSIIRNKKLSANIKIENSLKFIQWINHFNRMTELLKEEPLKMIAKWIELAIIFDIHDRFTSVALINEGVWWIKLNWWKMYRIKLIRIGSKSIETKQSNLKYIYARE